MKNDGFVKNKAETKSKKENCSRKGTELNDEKKKGTNAINVAKMICNIYCSTLTVFILDVVAALNFP